jgi:hypothetical protein
MTLLNWMYPKLKTPHKRKMCKDHAKVNEIQLKFQLQENLKLSHGD